MLLISHPSLMWEQRRADPPELLMSFQISQRILGGGAGEYGGRVKTYFTFMNEPLALNWN